MVLRATLIVFCVALNYAGLGDFACCPAWNLSIGVDWCPRHYWIYICLLSLPMSIYTVFWSILIVKVLNFYPFLKFLKVKKNGRNPHTIVRFPGNVESSNVPDFVSFATCERNPMVWQFGHILIANNLKTRLL